MNSLFRLMRRMRWTVVGAGATATALVLASTAGATHLPGFGHSQFESTPTYLFGSMASPLLTVRNSSTGGAVHSYSALGLAAYGAHYGAGATGTAPGVRGDTASTSAGAVGVLGLVSPTSPGSSSAGVRGINNGTGGFGIGVYGSQAGSGWGVYGTAPSGRGVYGASTSGFGAVGASSTGYGVYGSHGSTAGTLSGVVGTTSSTAAGAMGVYGIRSSTTSQVNTDAVRGTNNTPLSLSNLSSAGVRGISGGTGVMGQGYDGVRGTAAGSVGYAIYGIQGSGSRAGFFSGNVTVTGTLSKGGGTFKIDHPLDPANKYLSHSFVESPDMMNVYNGNVTTDSKGFATIQLPAYFRALNRDFRYQLTIIGTRGWNARVVKEIANDNSFTIQSDQPNVKVSWQVTGIRHDAFARAHPVIVEEKKQGAEKGRYLHPELYGKPASAGVTAAHDSALLPWKANAPSVTTGQSNTR